MIVFRDATFEKCLNEVRKVIGQKGKPLVITNSSELSAHLPGFSGTILQIPDSVDCLSSALAVIPLQLLAFHLAEIRGLNVDQPRALSKIVTSE